jgi:hypothetical protein
MEGATRKHGAALTTQEALKPPASMRGLLPNKGEIHHVVCDAAWIGDGNRYFTSDLSPLIIGLLGLLWLSAGFIIFAAIREHLSQKTKLMGKETPASEDHRDAA